MVATGPAALSAILLRLGLHSGTGRRLPLAGRAQPQRRPGRLHGVVDHGQQLGGEGVGVDLLTQPGRERLDGAGGVSGIPNMAP